LVVVVLVQYFPGLLLLDCPQGQYNVVASLFQVEEEEEEEKEGSSSK